MVSGMSAAVCGDLNDPVDGTVSMGGLQVGDTATYSCDSGFTLHGTSIRVCQIGGTWSGTEPTCKKWLKVHMHF